MCVDLHSHSTASDGTFRPSELPGAFAAGGIRVAGLTDHDTIGGVRDFLKACEEVGIVGIGGIEFSTIFRGIEVHLLGYGLPQNDPRCTSFLAGHAEYLKGRCAEILGKLNEHGYEISLDEVYDVSDGNPPMPPHILRVLAKQGVIEDLAEAVRFFHEYLAFDSKAWVDHETPIERPLGMLLEVGAVAIVGHPGRFPDFRMLEDLLDLGAHGFELYYPEQTGGIFDELEGIAKKRDCLVTGGSDYHGAFTERKIGEVDVPLWVALRLMEATGQEIPAALVSMGGGCE